MKALNFIEKKRFIIFFVLALPFFINSIFITIEENRIFDTLQEQESRKKLEENNLSSRYLNNFQAELTSGNNIFLKKDVIGKKIVFNFREKTNNLIGDVIKFIDNDSYNGLLHMPISYQSSQKDTIGIITFDYFKEIEINKNVIKDISPNGVFGSKIYNIEGTLVSYNLSFKDGILVTNYLCKLTLDTQWEKCGNEVVTKIKDRYVSNELVKDLLTRTNTTKYTIHDLGSKLFYVSLTGESRQYLYRCEDLVPDGTKGQRFQCINFIENQEKIKGTQSFQFDIEDKSTIVFTGSGNILKVNKTLDVDHIVNIDFETESNIYSFYEHYLNTKIFGHYSSGSLRTYGIENPFVEIYKPRYEKRPPNDREMSSFDHLNGNELYGLYPWGELWIRNINKNDNFIEMFNNTNAGDYVFPFESPIKDFPEEIYNKIGYDFLAQKINNITPCFEGLCISTGNKSNSGVDESVYRYILNEIPEIEEYSKIYYLPGNKQICTYTNEYLKTLEVEIQENTITLNYQGKECYLNNPNKFNKVELLSDASLELENFVFIEEGES